MTFADMAAELSDAIGKPIQYIPITLEDFRAGVAEAAGPFIAGVFEGIARETLDGRNSHLNDGIQRALGRAPRDFATFAKAAAKAGAWANT